MNEKRDYPCTPMTQPTDGACHPAAVPRRSTRVVSRMVSGEHILVPLASRGAELDSIFNLNSTGSFVWDRIDGRKTAAEIAALLAADFEISGDQALADCLEFLAQLLEARAIEFGDTRQE